MKNHVNYPFGLGKNTDLWVIQIIIIIHVKTAAAVDCHILHGRIFGNHELSGFLYAVIPECLVVATEDWEKGVRAIYE